MIWTDKRIVKLRHMWAEGYSAALIGEAMGTTRNGILGKVHRLQLPARVVGSLPRFHKPQGRNNPEVSPTNFMRQHAKPVRVARVKPYLKPLTFTPAVTELPMPKPRMVKLLDLQPEDCHWPIGDPTDRGFGFCGQPNGNGPYCPYHRALSYTPVPKRKPRRSFFVRGWEQAA